MPRRVRKCRYMVEPGFGRAKDLDKVLEVPMRALLTRGWRSMEDLFAFTQVVKGSSSASPPDSRLRPRLRNDGLRQ